MRASPIRSIFLTAGNRAAGYILSQSRGKGFFIRGKKEKAEVQLDASTAGIPTRESGHEQGECYLVARKDF